MGSGPRLYTEGHVAAERERKMDRSRMEYTELLVEELRYSVVIIG
jgi:hypothetical protein